MNRMDNDDVISKEEEEFWAKRIHDDLNSKLDELIDAYNGRCPVTSGIGGILAFAIEALRMHHAMMDCYPACVEDMIRVFSQGMRLPEDDGMRALRLSMNQEYDESES